MLRASRIPARSAGRGWHLSDLNRMVDDVLTQSETVRLREFRDGHHPASETPGDRGASLLAAAARAAVATRQRRDGWSGYRTFCNAPAFPPEESRELLLQAWETAVARQLGDVGIDLDREAALLYYTRHFDLTMPSWTITGCCASSFREPPSPKRRPVWCPAHERSGKRASVRTAAQVGAAGVAL